MQCIPRCPRSRQLRHVISAVMGAGIWLCCEPQRSVLAGYTGYSHLRSCAASKVCCSCCCCTVCPSKAAHHILACSAKLALLRAIPAAVSRLGAPLITVALPWPVCVTFAAAVCWQHIEVCPAAGDDGLVQPGTEICKPQQDSNQGSYTSVNVQLSCCQRLLHSVFALAPTS
jgi:hypothetical protein